MKLISMKSFVLEQHNNAILNNKGEYTLEMGRCVKYAFFINLPLTLGMFVPCDLEGNVLKEPKQYRNWRVSVPIFDSEMEQKCIDFEQAKERVLFEGFELKTDEHGVDYLVGYDRDIMPNNDFLTWNNEGLDEKYLSIIECLVYFNPILTSSAIKQIGL